jgi:hypothetical protein
MEGQMADAVQGSLTGLVNNQAGLAPPARKVVLASAFGTIIEWYDFFIYGTAAALVFAASYSATLAIVSAGDPCS